MSNFAIIWKQGGFSKFDTQTLNLIQETSGPDGFEVAHFQALALQHKTSAYVCCLESKPTLAITVLPNSSIIDSKKYFKEKLSEILVLPGAKYTLFCLETQIQIYTRNGKDLYDIIDCFNPRLTQAQIFEGELTLAYMGLQNRIDIKTYSAKADTIFTLNHDHEVGKISLKERNVASVSKDGCYIYVFQLLGNTKEL